MNKDILLMKIVEEIVKRGDVYNVNLGRDVFTIGLYIDDKNDLDYGLTVIDSGEDSKFRRRLKIIVDETKSKLRHQKTIALSSEFKEVLRQLKVSLPERMVNRELFAFSNGVFNFEKKIFQAYFTRDEVLLFKSPFNYEYWDSLPEPSYRGLTPSAFIKQLSQNNSEIEELLYDMMSVMVHQEVPSEKAVYFVGYGNDGKSTINQLFLNLAGQQNTEILTMREFAEESNLNKLHQKSLIIGDENYFDSRHPIDTEIINKVITGEQFRAHIFNERRFSTMTYALVIQNGNILPTFINKSNGALRRWLFVQMQPIVSTEDKTWIKREFVKEPRILSWLLFKAVHRGVHDLKQRKYAGLEHKTKEQIIGTSPAESFLNEMYDKQFAKMLDISSKLLYQWYLEFMRQDDSDVKPYTQRKFTVRVQSFFLSKGWKYSSKNHVFSNTVSTRSGMQESGFINAKEN